MTQTTRGPKKAAKPETIPPPPDLEVYAEEGDTVQWFPGADANQPHPLSGVVTKLGLEHTVTVNRFSPDLCDTTPQDGVRHVNDPKARVDGSAGGWRHRRLTVATRAMLIHFGLLVWQYTTAGQWVLAVNQAALDAFPAQKPTDPESSSDAA